jgi:alginate O-acetyltransferase complex protein AlgI
VLFNSYTYMFMFLPVTLVTYFLLNRGRLTKAATAWLVFASLFFYSWWNIRYLALIVGSIIFNFAVGTSLRRRGGSETGGTHSRAILIAGIFGDVLLLCYYKYTDFLIQNLDQLTGVDLALQHIVLPLGISFFTFTQIAFLVDTYRGTAREYDFLRYALFVSFFPHLLAGPIIHHKEMMPQFADLRRRLPDYRNIAPGLFLFFLGLFKKVVIADALAPVATFGFDHATKLTLVEAWVTSLSYTLQLYFDFSAYTDMALGASQMFNIHLPRNFDSPYKATDIADFWRRWHMTLSRFLRDYVYIPLGGNRAGVGRTYANLLTTFLIGGIWHGAGWTFVFWGFLHGIATVFHRFWGRLGMRLPRIAAWFLTFNFVNLAWVFFRARTWNDALKVLAGMAGKSGVMLAPSAEKDLSFLKQYGVSFGEPFFRAIDKSAAYLLGASLLLALFARNSDQLAAAFRPSKTMLALTILLAVSALISMNKVSEFLYFNF